MRRPDLKLLREVLRRPWGDLAGGLEGALGASPRRLAVILAAVLAGWWLVVPVHELSHAAACRLAGGRVERLEIDALYGGALLARVFPFVVPASDYAGRLSGFDTGGSDLTYLATDLGPYLWTLWPGVWALRRTGRRGCAAGFGLFVPLAAAPFLALTGDAYEIGSLAVTRLAPWSEAATRTLLRGDDLLLKAGELAALGRAAPWAGFVLAAGIGVAWAFAWYLLASALAAALGEPPLGARAEEAQARR